MIAEELINELIPALRPRDTAWQALERMDEFRISQLPVVEERRYLGLVSDLLLQNLPDQDLPLSQLPYLHPGLGVAPTQHYYEVLKIAHDHEVDLIPVIAPDLTYSGSINIRDSISVITRTFATQANGAIVVLSMGYRDYSLSEISRLVESNNAKILSSFVEADKTDAGKIRLTLKLDTADTQFIIATLERYDYRIIGKYQSTEGYSLAAERLDMLFKYLDL